MQSIQNVAMFNQICHGLMNRFPCQSTYNVTSNILSTLIFYDSHCLSHDSTPIFRYIDLHQYVPKSNLDISACFSPLLSPAPRPWPDQAAFFLVLPCILIGYVLTDSGILIKRTSQTTGVTGAKPIGAN